MKFDASEYTPTLIDEILAAFFGIVSVEAEDAGFEAEQ